MLNSILSAEITLTQFLICELTAMILGFGTSLIFQVRDKHTSTFSQSLALLPGAVTLVIMLVNGNIGAGLAVAGTFALVRFRSAPGTAKEITGLFMTVAIGLACGMGYVGVAVIFFVLMGLYVLLLGSLRYGEESDKHRHLKITVPENVDYETLFEDIFDEYTSSRELTKVRTTNMGTLYELTYRIVLKDAAKTKEFLDELRCRNGNLTISCGKAEFKEAL
jgi:uncharacterized membrane protein YhiD involved in acid resistance